MIPSILLVITLLAASPPDLGAPGNGLGLAERPVVSSPIAPSGAPTGTPMESLPHAGRGVDPWAPSTVAIGGAAALLAIQRARRRDDEPFYVVVHGNGGSADDFDQLLDRMDVGEDRVAVFDYRLAGPGASSTDASRSVPTDDVAIALDRFIRGAAQRHSNVYSIHHSKGAAAGVVTIAAIDEGSQPPIDGYRGAALLDPPIAGLPLGPLQRFGQPIPQIADNGGFNPIRCSDDGCRDIREHLGKDAGVEVIAIRNPDAEITNFTDEPEGLRVYDLVDDGGSSAWRLAWQPFAFVRRVFEAHSSVLRHPAVADCIVEEAAKPGSCDWKGSRPARRPMWGSGNGKNLVR
ncbi:MAG: hypothetical protein ACR2NG_02140 [Acidimicrobiia bacterium]